MTERNKGILRFSPRNDRHGYRGHEKAMETLRAVIGLAPEKDLIQLTDRLEKLEHDQGIFGRTPAGDEEINRIIYQINLILYRLSGSTDISYVDCGYGFSAILLVGEFEPDRSEDRVTELYRFLMSADFSSSDIADIAFGSCMRAALDFGMGMARPAMVQLLVKYAFEDNKVEAVFEEAERKRHSA